MPLSNVVRADFWSKSQLPALTFNSVTELRKFVERGQVSIKAVLQNHIHDAMSPASDFYKFYKQNANNTIRECYQNFEFPVDENSDNCVGRSFKIRYLLLRDLDEEYPELKKCLFLASTAKDEKYAYKLPKLWELEKENYHLTQIIPHCVLVSRIIFEARKGVVVFETINTHYKPVIIMDDNGFPSDCIVPLRKDKFFRFLSIEGKYVRHTVESSRGVILRQMFYVEKSYSRCDFSVKLLCLSNCKFLNYALVKDEKIPVNITVDFLKKDIVFYWEIDGANKIVKIPFPYFSGKQINPQFEDVFKKAAILLGNIRLKSNLKYLVESIGDVKFNNEASEYLKFIRQEDK